MRQGFCRDVEGDDAKVPRLAKEHGVTEESMNANFPISEESTSNEQSQEAESIFGPMVTLQSNFVW